LIKFGEIGRETIFRSGTARAIEPAACTLLRQVVLLSETWLFGNGYCTYALLTKVSTGGSEGTFPEEIKIPENPTLERLRISTIVIDKNAEDSARIIREQNCAISFYLRERANSSRRIYVRSGDEYSASGTLALPRSSARAEVSTLPVIARLFRRGIFRVVVTRWDYQNCDMINRDRE